MFATIEEALETYRAKLREIHEKNSDLTGAQKIRLEAMREVLGLTAEENYVIVTQITTKT